MSENVIKLREPRYLETGNDTRDLIDTLHQTNQLLHSIATTANATLNFFRKWIWIAVAVASFLWPSVGKIVDRLPSSSASYIMPKTDNPVSVKHS